MKYLLEYTTLRYNSRQELCWSEDQSQPLVTKPTLAAANGANMPAFIPIVEISNRFPEPELDGDSAIRHRRLLD